MAEQTVCEPATTDNYQPHTGQREFHKSDTRFRVLACGRRWGKDYCTIHEAVANCFPSQALVWWVAPQYTQSRIGWEMALGFVNRNLVREVNRSEMFIEFINGSQLWFKTADNPDALRGRGIDFLVIDEAATVKREAWENVLRPSLSDTQGHAVFIGTPKGHNWFFDLWTRGNDPLFTDYKSWTYPSSANPYLSQKDIEEAKATLPDLVFRQEYLAEFLDDYGAVFRGVNDCVKGEFEEPTQGKTYVAGCDLAKLVDFMVTIVMDDSGHVVALDRFNKLEWPLQRQRVIDLCRKYHARLLIDSSGIGDPNYDEFKRSKLSVEGYKFTNASKKALIENLSHLIEKQEVSFPNPKTNPLIQVLIDELHMFGYKITEGGVVSYGAPEGYHDDCVIALALASWMNVSKGDIHAWTFG